MNAKGGRGLVILKIFFCNRISLSEVRERRPSGVGMLFQGVSLEIVEVS